MSELYIPAAVAPPQAADAAGAGLGLTDSIYNRLLKERIIWLGSEVRDDNANAICAQMLLLKISAFPFSEPINSRTNKEMLYRQYKLSAI